MKLEIRKVENKADKPEEEYLEISVLEDTNLVNYAVLDNSYDEQGKKSNIHRHFYKFPNCEVGEGDTVMLYSGVGEDHPRKLQGSEKTTHFFYWRSQQFIWNNEKDFARLYELKLEDSREVGTEKPKAKDLKEFIAKRLRGKDR